MTEFTERYKQLSDSELLAILADASSYQPIAVETAKQELDARKLTEDQIKDLEVQNSLVKEQKTAQLQKRKEENETLKNDFFALFTTVNPFAKQLELYEKQIRFMCWFFAAFAVYAVVSDYSLMGFYFEDLFTGKIDVDLVLYFTIMISILLGAILFWKRKTAGWILIMFYLSTSLTGLLVGLIYHLTKSTPQYYQIIDDTIMPTEVIGIYVVSIIIYGTNFYVLLKEKVKAVFKIDSTIAVLTIVLPAAIQTVIWLQLFLN